MKYSGNDPRDVSQSGWGVIFPAGAGSDHSAAVREALSPLLELRRSQAGELYREFYGAEGYRPGETKNAFLARQGAGPGLVWPEKVPYYLLLAGSPRQIPFRFQWDLGIQYAVGRLDFDTPEAYAAYTSSVLRAEESWQPQRAGLFGTLHADDLHTRLVNENLLGPLSDRLAKQSRWEVQSWTADAARKENLIEPLSEGNPPALMLLTGHGLAYPFGHPLQREFQGGLLCQDWPGPQAGGATIAPEWCFTAADVPPQADLTGMIWLQFASFSAGTNQPDPLFKDFHPDQAAFAPEPFTAHLAQRLLSLPNGAALAVAGLAGPLWSYAHPEEMDRGARLSVYYELVDRLARGEPLGSAVEPIHARYAEIASELRNELEEISFGKHADPLQLARLWAVRNDARSFIILGDPAVRLKVASFESLASQKAIKQAPARSASVKAEPSRLQAKLQLRMARLPTFLYPFLDEDTHPLVSLTVSNSDYDRTIPMRARAEIQNYSTLYEIEGTVGPLSQATWNLLPPLLPEIQQGLMKLIRANLEVRVEEQDSGQVVWQDTRPVWVMDSQTLPLAVRDPATAEWQDFAFYLGLFINPQHPALLSLVDRAAARSGFAGRSGYEVGPDGVESLVRAIVKVLHEEVRLSISRGEVERRTSESITFPMVQPVEQILASRKANSLEVALLFTALLEAARLNPALVLIQGMALAAWQETPQGDRWRYFDFTKGSLGGIFDESVSAAEKLAERYSRLRRSPGEYPSFIRLPVEEMRRRGIQPLV